MLKSKIQSLMKSPIKKVVDSRLKELSSNESWFSELCFCILTANSKAKTALAIQSTLGEKGFATKSADEIRQVIIDNKHRFHNNKTKYIMEARKYKDIKYIVQSMEEYEAREWIVNSVKGIGWKEASHFLRNVGYTNFAILDRHILNLMVEEGMLEEKPKTLTKKIYLDIEKKLDKFSKSLGLNQAELDFYMWYLKTGEILK